MTIDHYCHPDYPHGHVQETAEDAITIPAAPEPFDRNPMPTALEFQASAFDWPDEPTIWQRLCKLWLPRS